MTTINSKARFRATRLSEPVNFGLSLGAGLLFGLNRLPEVLLGVIYAVFFIYCIGVAFQNNISKFFKLLPHLVYYELIVRANSTHLPALTTEYGLIVCFSLLLINNGTKLRTHSRAFVFIFLYVLVEAFDYVRTQEPDFARLAITNSTLLLLIALWASSNTLSIKILNSFIFNLKLGSIFLTGNILAAHLFGHISYSGFSNREATNFLAPVQVSAYLGLGTILFFLSLVNPLERKKMALNIFLFSLSCIIMLLSFSRGGLYFLAIIVMFYMIFNRKKMGSYFAILILVPIAVIIYYYVIQTTNGLILDRYEQAGSSGRDRLIVVGFQIFKTDPLAGIGTGNFSKEIVRRHLYEVESGAHNDFIRALAEHGLLGIITYWGFYLYMFIELMMQKGIVRQYAFYFFVLFCLIIVHNGLKISLQHVLLIFIICRPVINNKPLPGPPGVQPKLSTIT